jgi:hypothetical protein
VRVRRVNVVGVPRRRSGGREVEAVVGEAHLGGQACGAAERRRCVVSTSVDLSCWREVQFRPSHKS